MKFKRTTSAVCALALVAGMAAAPAQSVIPALQTAVVASANDFTDAININVNQQYSDSLAAEAPLIYKFSIPEDGYVSIDFQKTYTKYGHGWKVGLYRIDTTWVFDRTIGVGDIVPFSSCKIGLEKGDYYVRIGYESDYNYTDADYSFMVKYTSSKEWEHENSNEDFMSATELSVGKKCYGCIDGNSDEDFYKFDIPSTGKYRLYFGKEFCDTTRYGWSLELFDKYIQNTYGFTVYAGNTTTENMDIRMEKGTNYLRIAPSSTYCSLDVTYNFQLVKVKEFGDAEVTLPQSTYVYNGKSIYPEPTVKYGGKKLKKGTDYTVRYGGNTNCGKGYVYISGKGEYSGSYTKAFIIKPKKVTSKKLTSPKKKTVKLTWAKANGNVDGYQIMLGTNKKLTAGKKSVFVKRPAATAKTVKGLKKGKMYYARIRAFKKIDGKNYFGAWSKLKKVKCK